MHNTRPDNETGFAEAEEESPATLERLMLSMRSKVALSGLAYFACMLVVAAIASPTLLNLLGKTEGSKAIAPIASLTLPNLLDGDISPDGQSIAVGTSKGIEIRSLADGSLERRLGSTEAYRVLWSPDGNRIAATSRENLYVYIWDLAFSVSEPKLHLERPTSRFNWFPDSKRIATLTRDGSLLIRDTDTGETLCRLDPPEGYSFCDALSISPTSMIAAGCFKGANALLVVWNSTTYQTYEKIYTRPVNTTSDPTGAQPSGSQLITQLAWSPNGTALSYLVANWPGTSQEWFRLELWRVDPAAAEQESWVIPINGDPHAWMHSYAWSPTGNSIAYIRNMSHTLGIYSLEDGRVTERGIDEKPSWGSFNRVLGFTPNGQALAAFFGNELQILIFDPDGLEPVLSLNQYGWLIKDAAISPDGGSIATLDANGRAVVFDLSLGRIESVFKTPTLDEGRISFTRDGEGIIVCSDDGVSVWSRVTGVLEISWDLGLWGSLEVGLTSSDLSPDGSTVAFVYVGMNRMLQALELRRVVDGGLIERKDLPPGRDLGQLVWWPPVRWSPDQQEIAFTDFLNIFVWNLSSGEVTGIGVHTNPAGSSSLTWHPVLPLLVSAGNGTVVWNVSARQPVVSIDRAMYRAVFSPDGAMICDGSTIYNSTTLEAIYALESPGPSSASSWSPDGRCVVTVAPEQGLVSVYKLPG